MGMWIVMDSSAKMPSRCWGRYRNVAIVELTQYATAHGVRPKQISARDKYVLRVVRMGHHSVGKTKRCAFERAYAAAEARAYELNNAKDMATVEQLIPWGGSA